jgi:DNA-binding transcriptional regulator YiaG
VANLGILLKEEITRLSRREIRKQTALLHKTSASYRRDIAALKRRLAAVERSSKLVDKKFAKVGSADVATTATTSKPMRFVAKGFKSLRQRLGLSAAQMGKLLGVSEQSIYNWESKKTLPRRAQLPAIAELRGQGKRDVSLRLNAAATSRRKREK